jgi:flagellar hook-basal body complex protein FliE
MQATPLGHPSRQAQDGQACEVEATGVQPQARCEQNQRSFLMPETLNTRVARIEEFMGRAFTAIEVLAEKEARLDDVLVTLSEAQIKTEERFQRTDERIDKLVSAIGELLRNGRGK